MVQVYQMLLELQDKIVVHFIILLVVVEEEDQMYQVALVIHLR
jgi:hypothetical protein